MSLKPSVHFTRDGSIADLIIAQVCQSQHSVEAALYRLNFPRLEEALAAAAKRGIKVRLVLDRGKYRDTRTTRELLAAHRLPSRLLAGRQGDKAKMHHKFAILDGRAVLTGSYNWTTESEELNFDNLVVLRDRDTIKRFSREFELLWNSAEDVRPRSE